MTPLGRNILVALGTLVLLGGILSMVNLDKPKTIDVSAFASGVQEGKVEKVVVQGNKLNITFKDGQKAVIDKESTESLSELLRNYGVDPARLRTWSPGGMVKEMRMT
jgi:hypothetical protein